MTLSVVSGVGSNDMSVDELASALGEWHQGSGALYLKLAGGLRRLLGQGLIATGSHLPPERTLAAVLAVSRNTVSAAYAELRLDGWVDAHQGSATTVTASGFSPVGAHRSSPLFATLMREHPQVIDLTVAVPRAAPVVRKLVSNPASYFRDEEVTAGHGYYPQGYPPLRARLAEILTDFGLPTTADQLLITTGAQQAISITIRALTRPGDTIGVEEVSFPGAIDATRLAGGKTLALPLTKSGVDLDGLDNQISNRAPRLLYLIPSFHNPTGSTLHLPERKRLTKRISDSGTTTIDDMTLADLGFSGEVPRPLAAIDPDAPIISVGSLSKVFWGGLRVGWLRANETLIRYMSGIKATADLGTSALSQKLAFALLADYDATRTWRRNQLIESMEAASEALRVNLPDWRWDPPAGGPHLWLELPEQDSMPFSQQLMRHGIAVVAGPLLAAADAAGQRHIRMPLYQTPEELQTAIVQMAEVWHRRS